MGNGICSHNHKNFRDQDDEIKQRKKDKGKGISKIMSNIDDIQDNRRITSDTYQEQFDIVHNYIDDPKKNKRIKKSLSYQTNEQMQSNSQLSTGQPGQNKVSIDEYGEEVQNIVSQQISELENQKLETKVQQPKIPLVLLTKNQLTEHGIECIQSELSSDLFHHIIDIAKISKSVEEVFQQMAEEITIFKKEGPKRFDWKNVLEYHLDLSEIMLKYIDVIVVDHKKQIESINKLSFQGGMETYLDKHIEKDESMLIPIQKRIPIWQSAESYDFETLKYSIEQIYKLQGDDELTLKFKMDAHQKIIQDMVFQLNVHFSPFIQLRHTREKSMDNLIPGCLLAVHFFLNTFQVDDKLMMPKPSIASILAKMPYINFGQLRQSKEFRVQYIPFVKEVEKWLKRLMYVAVPFRGECTYIREELVSDQEIAYYDVGKMCMFQKIFVANIGKEANASEVKEAGANAVFHIYSLSGRPLKFFLDSRGLHAKHHQNKLMFQRGCQFLVCKKKEIGGVWHIYLREVELGICGNQNVFWVDDKLTTRYNRENIWLSLATQYLKDHTTFITRNSSAISVGYFHSIFFKLSLLTSDTFTLVQQQERANEGFISILTQEKGDKKLSGKNLMIEFNRVLLGLDSKLISNTKVRWTLYSGPAFMENKEYDKKKEGKDDEPQDEASKESTPDPFLDDLEPDQKAAIEFIPPTDPKGFAQTIHAYVCHEQFHTKFSVTEKPMRKFDF